MTRLNKEQIDNLPEWMTIPDFPSYEVNCREGIIRNVSNLKVLKPGTDGHGYPQVWLSKDGRKCTKKVHRIIAVTAFHHYGISTDGFDVCHLDEERWDARIFNLSLGSRKENSNFPKAKQRYSEAKKGKYHSEETRMKMSEARKGEKAYWFGKHHSEEYRKKLSQSHKGKRLSEETIKKITEAKSKPVGAYKNGELVMIFQSTQEADRNGFASGNVSRCCTGRRRVCKGYEWRYL